jgi:hypothetical protein
MSVKSLYSPKAKKLGISKQTIERLIDCYLKVPDRHDPTTNTPEN